MPIRDLFGRLAPTASRGKVSKLASRLEGETSRMVRNTQSAINKDIKATRKALELSEGVERDNLQAHLDALSDLKNHMRASRKIDGETVYNARATRLEAVEEYNKSFRGAKAREGHRGYKVDRIPIENRMYVNLASRLRSIVADDMWSPQLEDLLEEYYDAVRAYDYEKALETLAKMRGTKANIELMYDDVHTILGSVDDDGR